MVTPLRRDGYLSRPGVDVTAVPFHPILATAYPVVFLFATNVADQVTIGPLWRPLRDFAWLDASPEQVAQKFGILDALRLPGIDAQAAGLHARSTPVNNLRIVLNSYFDAGLAILPDTTYLSPDYPRAYDFVPVERDEEGLPIMSGLEGPEP
jgi:hypothetical protein